MSNKLVNIIKDLDVELSPPAKFVLWALADRYNPKTGRCDPSHERLAKDTGLCRRTILRSIKILDEKDLISVTKRNGGHTSNKYSFRLDRFDKKKPDVTHSHTSSDETDVTLSPTDVTDSHGNCDSESNRRDSESQETKETNLNQKKPAEHSQFNDQSDLEKWLCVYPKKGNLKAIVREWKKLKPDADVLIADTEKRKQNDRRWLADITYVWSPENYLRDERWKDPIEPVRKSESEPMLPRDDNQLEDWAVGRGIHQRGKAPQNIATMAQYRQWLQKITQRPELQTTSRECTL